MVASIEENFVRRIDVSSPIFDIIQFLLNVYAFIIPTLKRTYIKYTTYGHHQCLLLQVEQKSLQICSYQISLDDHDVHSLLYRNTSACHFDVRDRIIEGYFWTADKIYCSGNEKLIEWEERWRGFTQIWMRSWRNKKRPMNTSFQNFRFFWGNLIVIMMEMWSLKMIVFF